VGGQAQLHGLDPFEVHVNVAPRQLMSADFPATVADALAGSGLRPELLCLEITERTLTRDEDVTAEALRCLRALGVHVSVDDFGTGYASLSYLKRFPIDSLKVDRSFVADLGEDPENSAIVEAIIALAHSLRIAVVAEGVETDIAYRELVRLSCGRAQGYLFGAPEDPDVLEAKLFASALRFTA
jgi:EAL domain-containing protein (putative c-di-GMP-specific phosphodiesterase class I)